MNDDHDALEAELRSFRPREPSRSLLVRIGRELATNAPTAVRKPPGVLAGLGLVAASLAVIALVNHLGSQPPRAVVKLTSPEVASTPAPTLSAYRQALAKSPEALDELLNQQALRNRAFQEQERPLTASTALRSEFLNSLGDTR